ncbi:MAG: quinolinate synthase NadA [Eubacteriales bacterium]|nr:quinolinate synthase NadA [Eubacteriales bacterium]
MRNSNQENSGKNKSSNHKSGNNKPDEPGIPKPISHDFCPPASDISDLPESELVRRINELRRDRNAVIVAHYYQVDAVQEIADMVGDSFALAKYCAASDKPVIVFCGVHFMAESAYILSPNKTVLLPSIDAGCPMADMADAESLRTLKAEHPDAAVVSYINTSAEVKAESDVCVTSSNAVKIVKSLAQSEIIFVPDQNLGGYVAKQVPEKKFYHWQGFCITHHRLGTADVERVRNAMPGALLLVHPEVKAEVADLADFVGSTKQIIEYATQSKDETFIIGTEMGVMYELKKRNPDKKFYLLAPGLMCRNMKKTLLRNVYDALNEMKYSITVEEDIRTKAQKSLDRMLELG